MSNKWLRALCAVIGHSWRRKMYGRLCDRCGEFESWQSPS